MLSIAKVTPGAGWRYYFRSVMVGDGLRSLDEPLHNAQAYAGVPPGRWTGRGLAALGVVPDEVVTERQAELLFGQGLHPDSDRIERDLLTHNESSVAVRRATVLGRPIGDIRKPLLALDLVFRPPPTVHVLWALADDHTRLVLEECQDVARERTLAWVEEAVAQVRWGSGGRHRGPTDGLTVAVFRHYDNRDGSPLLHDHALVSVKVRRPDGQWGNLATTDLFESVVAAGTLYTLLLTEEISERLGLAWEPREATAGRRPVMEIAGIPHELIEWQATRSTRIQDAYKDLAADYVTKHGHPPGERARYRLRRRAAEETRPQKKTPLPLTTLRQHWRASAIRRFGARLIDGLLETAQAAAAAIRSRVRPAIDVALAAIDVVATVYVMRGSFSRRHLLAEARRHLAQTLRGHRHQPGLDEQIVDTALAQHTTRLGKSWTADFTALYPPGPEADAATLRTITRHRTKSPYERAQVASTVLADRLRTARRSRRMPTRPTSVPAAMPRTVRLTLHSPRRLSAQQDTDFTTLQNSHERIATLADDLVRGVHERNRSTRSRQPSPRLDIPSQPSGT
ncbi:MobF family relaxase [Streptomyces sp. NPDC048639]|uniref:MobF family relaxase n=1 Tax=Streptomyces sp. NPDC048639 TaxID=3365581 RepID=UPI00372432E0